MVENEIEFDVEKVGKHCHVIINQFTVMIAVNTTNICLGEQL